MQYLYHLCCVIVPCLIFQIIVLYRNKTYFLKSLYIRHFIWCFVFMFYLFLVFNVTGIGSIWDIGKYDTIIRIEEINLIPFSDTKNTTMIFNRLNAVMFIPFGFLLPLIWKKHRNMINVVLTGALFSFSIEFCQLFNRRATDIDDLLMNTLGAAIGYSIWKLCSKFIKNDNAISLSQNESYAYLILSLLGTFLLYNGRITI